MPNSRWCKYDINPIATTLRPADEDSGVTPDMVLPIHPNTKHAHGPEPVRPTPSFPFSNCYHWYFNTLRARVRVHKAGYNESSAIFQSSLAVNRRFEDAYHRSIALLEKRGETSTGNDSATLSIPTSGLDLDSSEVHMLSELYRRLAVKHGLLTSMSPEDSYYDSDDDGGSDDLFGWDPDPATALLPLLDAWIDIADHISEDEIPSPVDFDSEIRETIEYVSRRSLAHATLTPDRIIKRGLVRYASSEKAAPTAKPATSGGGSEDAPPPHLSGLRVSASSSAQHSDVHIDPPTESNTQVRLRCCVGPKSRLTPVPQGVHAHKSSTLLTTPKASTVTPTPGSLINSDRYRTTPQTKISAPRGAPPSARISSPTYLQVRMICHVACLQTLLKRNAII